MTGVYVNHGTHPEPNGTLTENQNNKSNNGVFAMTKVKVKRQVFWLETTRAV